MVSELAGIGRLVEYDERNKNYTLPKTTAPEDIRWKYWWCPNIMDQGSTPHCVAYAGFSWLKSGPVTNEDMTFTPAMLYQWAQERDEWPGEDYEGTSGLGLMKALKERGYITEYRWAFDVDTIFN